LRDVLSHSPFITTSQDDSGFVDVKQLRGVFDGNPIPVKVLTFEEVASKGWQISKVLKQLLEFF
jgi:hypothetical protein